MKSILFCTSFIKDGQAWESRYQRWLDFYKNVPINAVKRIMIDDGSPFLPPAEIIRSVPHNENLSSYDDENLIVRFNDNLGRQSMSAYPGWWRSFLHSVTVAKNMGVDKIIHIESDAFILSQRLVDFINQTQSGWHVLWAQRYGMPETAIQIICRDQFENLEKLKERFPTFDFPDIAERILPFTSVDRRFKGDRYSEFKRNRWIFRSQKFNRIPIFQWNSFWEPIPNDADFVTQCVSRQRIKFRP
jgi:hypothetical protein